MSDFDDPSQHGGAKPKETFKDPSEEASLVVDDILEALNAVKEGLNSVSGRLDILERRQPQGAVGGNHGLGVQRTGGTKGHPQNTDNTENIKDPEETEDGGATANIPVKHFNIPENLKTTEPSVVEKTSIEIKNIYAAYQALKDSVSKVRLSEDLILSDAKFTCKDTSKKSLGITRKVGNYLNTTWKVLVEICNNKEINDAAADRLYVCLKAMHFSLFQELQLCVLEGTNAPKEVLSSTNVMARNPILDEETVNAFRLSCDVYAAAEKAKGATKPPPVENKKSKWLPKGKTYSNQSRGGSQNRGFYQGQYDPRSYRDVYDASVQQNATKP